MNKKYIQFLICMILSVALVLMMSVGVFAEPADEPVDEPVGDTTGDTDGDIADGDVDGDYVEDPIEPDPYDAYEYICGDKENGLAMYYDAAAGNGLFYLEETVNGETVRWHSTGVPVRGSDYR